jgi:hypothetical protein
MISLKVVNFQPAYYTAIYLLCKPLENYSWLKLKDDRGWVMLIVIAGQKIAVSESCHESGSAFITAYFVKNSKKVISK